MKKALSWLQRVENLLIIITFTIMVIASFSQVLNRNIFKLGIGWFEEIAVYCMIWMTLLGTEMGLRDGTQASVTALVDKLHGLSKNLLQLIAKIFVVIFTAIITKSAWGMVMKQIATGQTSPALHIPMAIPYMALLVSFAIMTMVQGATCILMVTHLKDANASQALDSSAKKEEGK
ncbi:MAG: C4-dicarboxylate transporter [Oscillospiraceae bacterium]|nr:C4-dicarboxylate transporter [Oscillospiraceae bacterium]